MYDQEHQDKTSETADRENRRRFIKGASAVAPVILTLTSPSLFGGELCLSQQLSGNVSGTPEGACIKGQAPSYWQNPLYKDSWPAGFSYGTLISGRTGSVCGDFTGGTKFNDIIAYGSGSASALRALLCTSLTLTNSIWVTALLNAAAFPNYVLTKQQVIDMNKGLLAPPAPYPNNAEGKKAFLKATW